ncbi:MAG: hypothetical protein NVSMB14_14600 [Isosphaeraceae bacterium]
MEIGANLAIPLQGAVRGFDFGGTGRKVFAFETIEEAAFQVGGGL